MVCDLVKNNEGGYCRSIAHEKVTLKNIASKYCKLKNEFPGGLSIEAYSPDDKVLNEGTIYTKYFIYIFPDGYSSIDRCNLSPNGYDDCVIIDNSQCLGENSW